MPRRVTQRAISASVVITTLMLAAGLSGCGKTETSASLMAEAKQYQQKGDIKAALIQLKNAATKSPEDAEVRFQLASLYNQIGDAVSAEKEIRKAISLGLDSARAAPELTKALLMQGKAQKAIEESAAAVAKAGPELFVARGDAYTALGELDKAKECFQRAIAAQPGIAGGLIGMARLAMFGKDVEAANRYLEQAISANPKSTAVWFLKGTMLSAQGKTDDAIGAYGQVIALQPGHVNALIERAQLQIGAGKFDAAKLDVDAARKAAPNALVVLYTQALLDFKLHKFTAAQESLQKVLRVAPEHMMSLLLSGAVELNLGTYQQAEQHLKKYLEKYPDNAYARKLLAQTLLKNAQPANAAAALAPLLKDGSQDAQLLALAGQSSLQGKDFNKAATYFEKASALAPKTAALHTSLGLSRLGQGDADKGISELETAAALDPASSDAGMALIQAELALKHYDKALAAADALEKNQPDNARLHNLKGGAYLAKGDVPKARASFEKAMSLQANYLGPVMNLAHLDMRDKKPEAAKKRFEAFLQHDKKNADAMEAMAQIAVAEGHPEQATPWLEKASTENPEAIGPALKLGAHYMATKQPQKALTLARKFQSSNPSNPELLDMLGQAQMATRDHGGALESYSKLVNVLPKSPMAQMRLAGVHMEMKNEAAAAEDLKRAIALQPDFMPARIAQVQLAMRQGKPDEAVSLARQVQKLGPNSPVGYALEGELQLALKRPALALPAYEKAFALGKSPQLLVKTVELMKQSGKTKEADARIAQWTQANPSEPVVQAYLSESYMANKQYKPAAEILREMLKRFPDNPVALNNLAWTYQQDKDPRALEIAERAAKVSPNSPAVMDTLGWLLVEQGNTARGLPLLQKAVGMAPKSPELRYHLAVALNKSGDKLGARKELEKLLADNKSFPQLDEARSLLKLL